MTISREKFWTTIAWRLPRRLVYWCAIRVWAAASQGASGQDATTITAHDALAAWHRGRGS